MKKKILLLPLFLPLILFAQLPFCNPISTGVDSSDEPPGCLMCINEYEGNTFGFSPDTFPYQFPCGTIENSQWLSIQADFTGKLEFVINVGACEKDKGVEIGLYDQTLDLINCISTKTVQSHTINGLEAGEIYWLMVDGIEGDICDFSIERIAVNVPLVVKTTNADRTQTCFGGEVCYEVFPPRKPREYVWAIDSGITVLSGGGTSDSTLCVRFEEFGKKNIEVQAVIACSYSHFFTRTMDVRATPVFLQKKTYSKCLGELPFTDFSQKIEDFGFTRIVYQTQSGCDSVYEFIVNRTLIEEDERKGICENDTIFVDNTAITEPGSYDFFYDFGTRRNQCDSSYSLNLFRVDTSAHQVSCVIDTFINAVGIKWTSNPEVTGYRLQINDSVIVLNNRLGYLYQTDIPNEKLEISLEPLSPYCQHTVSKITCINYPGIIDSIIPDTMKIDTPTINSPPDLFKIFPNPSLGIFRITAPDSIVSVEVFDFSGKEMLKTVSSKIDITKQPAGIYIFKIKREEEVFIRRVIKL